MSNIYLKGIKTIASLIMGNPHRPVLPSDEALASPRLQPSEPAPRQASAFLPRSSDRLSTQSKSPCTPCTEDHLSAVCRNLNEALRFSRREGVDSNEVQERLISSEDELNVWERWDARATEMVKLSPKKRELVNWALAQSKPIRDALKTVKTHGELEQLTADACTLRLQLKAKRMELPDEVVDISRKLETGEISKQEADRKVKELIEQTKK